MRVKKPRKQINKNCIDCGYVFIAYSKKALRCPECRKIKAREQSKKSMEFLRGHRSISTNSHRLHPKMTISEVLIALEEYNRENHAHLSYGQFVQKMESGCL